jgi:hypothetical protein
MTKTTKLLTALVCSVACFAPAVGIGIANGGLDSPEPWTPPEAVAEAPEAPPAEPASFAVPEVVVAAKAPPKAKRSPRRAKRSCGDQELEITGGTVAVCDVPRTANAKPGLWAPVAKPTRLASRDVPSPSGLLR